MLVLQKGLILPVPMYGGSYFFIQPRMCERLYSIAFSSFLANKTANTNAAASAIGPAYITPSIPIVTENTRINGKRNRTCLVRDMTIPSFALPMDVKKPDDTG